MSDAVVRAREIAARLSGISAGSSELGKRPRDEPPYAAPPGPPRGVYGSAAPTPPGSSIYGASAPSGEVTHDIYISNRHAGALIGRGGENLALLQRETGAHLDIQQQNTMKPGDDRRLVTVKGDEASAMALKLRVEAFMRDRESPAPAPPVASTHKFTQNFEVPDARVGTIIGRGGAKMREIMENTRAFLKIPTTHDAGNPAVRTIQISAEAEDDILACKAEILTLLDATAQNAQAGAGSSAPSSVPGGYSSSIIVPDDKVGAVIGKSGCVVKDIQTRLGVRLQIPTAADVGTNPPVRTITVSGPAHSVEAAKMEINEKVTYNPQLRQQGPGGMGGPPGGGASMYGPGTSGPSASSAQEDTTYYADYWNYASHYGEKAARQYYSTWAPPIGTRPPPGVIVAKDMTPEELAAAAAGKASAADAGVRAASSAEDVKNAEWDTYVKGYRVWWNEFGKASGAPEEPPKN